MSYTSSIRSVRQGTTELDTVTFSDQGNAPINVPEVKLWMRREGVTDEDVQIDNLIEDVIDQMMRITNMSLVSQTITAVYNSYGREINLPYSPVDMITSVKTLDEGTETTLTTDDYFLQGDTLHMKKLENTGLEVVYTSTGNFPNGLRNAVYQSILTNYNDREDNVLGNVVKIPNNSRKKALRYKRY